VSTEPIHWFTAEAGISRRYYKQPYRVMKLLAFIAENNGAVLTVREIAECLDYTPRHVSDCIAMARDRGLIRVEPCDGKASRYWLVTEGNPDAR
jgi:DNA-binding MarR family transcriptional regulator